MRRIKTAMKIWGGIILLGGGAPAWATGGYGCQTSDGSAIEFYATVSRTPIPTMVGPVMVSIKGVQYGEAQDEKLGTPKMQRAQSWFDDGQIMVDLVEPETQEPVMAIRTTRGKKGAMQSTIRYQGKVHPAQCEFE